MSKILVEEYLFDELLSKDLDWEQYSDLPPNEDKYYDDKEKYLSLLHKLLLSLCQFAKDWLNTIEGLLIVAAISTISTNFFKNLDKSLSDLLYSYTSEVDSVIQDAFRNGFKDASRKLGITLDSSYLNLVEKNALQYVQQNNFDTILNLSNDLKLNIRKVLYDGISQKKTIEEITNDLLKLPLEKLPESKFSLAQRAEMIAKTEYMRAYNRGSLYTYNQLGITHVRIVNNGDNICDYCIGLSKSGIYTIEEAMDLIPAHPRCKCTFEPVIPEGFDINNTNNYSYIYNLT